MEGTLNHATVKDFYGALQEDTSRRIFEIDELPVLQATTWGQTKKEELIRMAAKYSPVYNTVPVAVLLDKAVTQSGTAADA
jgi:hypothetical protein